MSVWLLGLLTTGGLSCALAVLLIAANRKLAVAEDPRVDAVDDMLPHANCGACGFPGCRPFAEALVGGKASPAKCTVSDDAGRARIAAYLGVDVGSEEKRVARLACAGGANVSRLRASYLGPKSCAAAAVVGGGGKGCSWGCLGWGDCARACNFGAIAMNDAGLPVVDPALCTACGDCVVACPKDLFSIHAVGHRLWVACKSEAHGDEILADCTVACTGCGRCAMDAPEGVEMKRHLPVINYARPQHRKAIERCPTGAIGWLADSGTLEVGAAAIHPVRNSARKPGPT